MILGSPSFSGLCLPNSAKLTDVPGWSEEDVKRENSGDTEKSVFLQAPISLFVRVGFAVVVVGASGTISEPSRRELLLGQAGHFNILSGGL